MLTQFRQRYPQGSLTSELLTIDCGQYVVRVSLQVEGMTLATGLAAARLIEEAEDKARQRALDTLDFTAEPPKPVSSPASRVSTPEIKLDSPVSSQQEAEINPIIEESTPEPSLPTSKTVEQITTSTPEPELELIPEPEPEPETKIKPELELIPELEPEPETNIEPELELTPEPEPVSPVVEMPEESPTVAEEAEELDFSEIIARSNAELKRLRWTQEEGRDYLIRTYGKRSRQLLSDEELLEFLHYLQGLPTVNS